jgi:predicted DNA-binding transcriptional regulator AlpA
VSDLMTVEEFAAKIKRPVATVRWWRSIGQGPKSGKLGRRVVYRTSDVEEWLESSLAATSRGGLA